MSAFEDHGPLQGDWPDKPAGAPPKRHKRGFFRELPFLIVVALALALLVKTFLVQAFYIPSESMEPTLHGCDGCRGDRVLVNRLVYRFRQPRRGEVIVFVASNSVRPERSLAGKIANFFTEGLGVARPDNPDFIKRIIGLPGETVQIKDAAVMITRADGKKLQLNEPYIAERETRPFGPFKVPADEYFVMGDNRMHSADSRFGLGTIRRQDIVGKAFVKIWPPGRMGRLAGASYQGDERPVEGIVLIGWWLVWRRRRRPFVGDGEAA